MDLQTAKKQLLEGGYTCVLCLDGKIATSTYRGVKPLLNWLDEGLDMTGASAADKVVGRATAFLYCLLGVSRVYAAVMSRPAAQVLEENGIEAHWGELVDGIINRRGTGPCPFEDAVMHITDSQEALTAIRNKMAMMQ